MSCSIIILTVFLKNRNHNISSDNNDNDNTNNNHDKSHLLRIRKNGLNKSVLKKMIMTPTIPSLPTRYSFPKNSYIIEDHSMTLKLKRKSKNVGAISGTAK